MSIGNKINKLILGRSKLLPGRNLKDTNTSQFFTRGNASDTEMCHLDKHFIKSLILAQDERWRHA